MAIAVNTRFDLRNRLAEALGPHVTTRGCRSASTRPNLGDVYVMIAAANLERTSRFGGLPACRDMHLTADNGSPNLVHDDPDRMRGSGGRERAFDVDVTIGHQLDGNEATII